MLKQFYFDKCKSSNFDAIPVSIHVWFLVNASNTKEKLSFIELDRCPLMTSEKLILVPC